MYFRRLKAPHSSKDKMASELFDKLGSLLSSLSSVKAEEEDEEEEEEEDEEVNL